MALTINGEIINKRLIARMLDERRRVDINPTIPSYAVNLKPDGTPTSNYYWDGSWDADLGDCLMYLISRYAYQSEPVDWSGDPPGIYPDMSPEGQAKRTGHHDESNRKDIIATLRAAADAMADLATIMEEDVEVAGDLTYTEEQRNRWPGYNHAFNTLPREGYTDWRRNNKD